jgi:hypothetical protein
MEETGSYQMCHTALSYAILDALRYAQQFAGQAKEATPQHQDGMS